MMRMDSLLRGTTVALAIAALTACSDASRESDENIGTEPAPEAEEVVVAGEEPAPETEPEAVEGEEPEPEPTVNEVAAAVGGLGEATGKEDEAGAVGAAEAAAMGDDSAVYIAADETWDERVGGGRLVLSYQTDAQAFVGTVENVTRAGVCGMEVAVRLSTGTVLGPTPATDIPTRQAVDIEIPTGGEAFEAWTAYMESSRCDR